MKRVFIFVSFLIVCVRCFWNKRWYSFSSPEPSRVFFDCCDSAADQNFEGSGNEDARYVATMNCVCNLSLFHPLLLARSFHSFHFFKRLSALERIRQISTFHRFRWFFLWASIIISHKEISHLLSSMQFFSLLARRFTRWPQNYPIYLWGLYNLSIHCRCCQNVIPCSNSLNILHIEVPFVNNNLNV